MISLFEKYSTEVKILCCFRDILSYSKSYIGQLNKQGIAHSKCPESYRYVAEDSWLFDYQRKKDIVESVVENPIYFDYDKNDNVAKFMHEIGYPSGKQSSYRLNVTPE